MAHPASGFYTKDDLEYVSVSTVLGATVESFYPGKTKGLEIWRQTEPDWEDIMQRAQRRGTIIHSEVELSLVGDSKKHKMDHPTMDEILSHNVHEYITYLSPVLEMIKKQNSKMGLIDPSLLIEEELFCHLGIAGTPDLRLTWDDQYTIWDWKSVRSYKEGVKKKAKSMSYYSEAEVQIGAYALFHNLAVKRGELDKPVTQGVICVCYDWREPHVHVLDKQELKVRALEFLERFDAYCSLVNASFPRAIKVAI